MSELIEPPPCPICGGALYRRKPPAAAAAAVGGDEITAAKLRAEEGLELYSSNMKYETYETEHLNDSLSVRINLNTGNVIAFDNDRDITITTMSELRTLVRWLS